MNNDGRILEYYKVLRKWFVIEISPISEEIESSSGTLLFTRKWMNLDHWLDLESLIWRVIHLYFPNQIDDKTTLDCPTMNIKGIETGQLVEFSYEFIEKRECSCGYTRPHQESSQKSIKEKNKNIQPSFAIVLQINVWPIIKEMGAIDCHDDRYVCKEFGSESLMPDLVDREELKINGQNSDEKKRELNINNDSCINEKLDVSPKFKMKHRNILGKNSKNFCDNEEKRSLDKTSGNSIEEMAKGCKKSRIHSPTIDDLQMISNDGNFETDLQDNYVEDVADMLPQDDSIIAPLMNFSGFLNTEYNLSDSSFNSQKIANYSLVKNDSSSSNYSPNSNESKISRGDSMKPFNIKLLKNDGLEKKTYQNNSSGHCKRLNSRKESVMHEHTMREIHERMRKNKSKRSNKDLSKIHSDSSAVCETRRYDHLSSNDIDRNASDILEMSLKTNDNLFHQPLLNDNSLLYTVDNSHWRRSTLQSQSSDHNESHFSPNCGNMLSKNIVVEKKSGLKPLKLNRECKLAKKNEVTESSLRSKVEIELLKSSNIYSNGHINQEIFDIDLNKLSSEEAICNVSSEEFDDYDLSESQLPALLPSNKMNGDSIKSQNSKTTSYNSDNYEKIYPPNDAQFNFVDEPFQYNVDNGNCESTYHKLCNSLSKKQVANCKSKRNRKTNLDLLLGQRESTSEYFKQTPYGKNDKIINDVDENSNKSFKSSLVSDPKRSCAYGTESIYDDNSNYEEIVKVDSLSSEISSSQEIPENIDTYACNEARKYKLKLRKKTKRKKSLTPSINDFIQERSEESKNISENNNLDLDITESQLPLLMPSSRLIETKDLSVFKCNENVKSDESNSEILDRFALSPFKSKYKIECSDKNSKEHDASPDLFPHATFKNYKIPKLIRQDNEDYLRGIGEKSEDKFENQNRKEFKRRCKISPNGKISMHQGLGLSRNPSKSLNFNKNTSIKTAVTSEIENIHKSSTRVDNEELSSSVNMNMLNKISSESVLSDFVKINKETNSTKKKIEISNFEKIIESKCEERYDESDDLFSDDDQVMENNQETSSRLIEKKQPKNVLIMKSIMPHNKVVKNRRRVPQKSPHSKRKEKSRSLKHKSSKSLKNGSNTDFIAQNVSESKSKNGNADSSLSSSGDENEPPKLEKSSKTVEKSRKVNKKLSTKTQCSIIACKNSKKSGLTRKKSYDNSEAQCENADSRRKMTECRRVSLNTLEQRILDSTQICERDYEEYLERFDDEALFSSQVEEIKPDNKVELKSIKETSGVENIEDAHLNANNQLNSEFEGDDPIIDTVSPLKEFSFKIPPRKYRYSKDFLWSIRAEFNKLNRDDFEEHFKENIPIFKKLAEYPHTCHRSLGFARQQGNRIWGYENYITVLDDQDIYVFFSQLTHAQEFASDLGGGSANAFAFFVLIPELFKIILQQLPVMDDIDAVNDDELENIFEDLMYLTQDDRKEREKLEETKSDLSMML